LDNVIKPTPISRYSVTRYVITKRVKKVFVETYLENIREGMNPRDALQKAKSVALCFLVVQQRQVKTGP